MKKMIRFLRSMQFGMILLVLVVICSFAGSMIPQERSSMEYVNRYGSQAAQVILALGLDDVFSSPCFLVLLGALCINLTLCSIVRLPVTIRAGKRLKERAASAEAEQPLDQPEKLDKFLRGKHFRAEKLEGRTVYTRYLAGYYGSFITHLSFLLILAVGAAALITADVSDRTVMPGETLRLEDGTAITVEAFQIEDASGSLDYASRLTAASADGKRQVQKEIRVNEPLSFNGYKIYQQTYGTAGSVMIENHLNQTSEVLTLTESCFLTLDGVNGVFFQALYPGYLTAEDGSVTLITSTSGNYSDPVYDILSVAEGEMTPVLAFPGDTLTIGDISFTFQEPVNYPGLRIKHMHTEILGMLYAVFLLMVIGLYLCFFTPPVAIAVMDDGYTLISPKQQTGLLIELEALFKEE